MSDVFDDIIDRQASPADVARIAAIVASDFRFCIFRHRRVRGAAVAARSEIDGRHPDESPAHGDAALMILQGYCT